MNNERKYNVSKKKNDFRCMVTLIREYTRLFETSQRCFLQEFSTHHERPPKKKTKKDIHCICNSEINERKVPRLDFTVSTLFFELGEIVLLFNCELVKEIKLIL